MNTEKGLKEEILKNEGRINSLKHNMLLMKLQKKTLIKQNKDFKEELRNLNKEK